MAGHRKERDSLVGPILLIGVGLIFLFNNLGWLDWSIWEGLWRLWPLLLIIGGLDLIIGRRSAVGGALVAALAVIMLVGGVWFVGVNERSPAAIVDGQAVAIPLQGAGQAQVEISNATGDLFLSDGAAGSNVLDGQIQNRQGETAKVSGEMAGGSRRASVKATGNSLYFFGGPNSIWDLHLNQEIPLALSVSTGVGESTLDLRRLTLSGLDVSMGVGQITVVLPRRGGFDGEISGGIGRMVVQVAENLPLRLEISTGIGGKSVPDSFRQEGDFYFSPTYDQGGEAVTLRISGGIGTVQVESLPAE